MIDQFLSKLFFDGKALKWFYDRRLRDSYEYWFFIRQIVMPWKMTTGLKETIQAYLDEE